MPPEAVLGRFATAFPRAWLAPLTQLALAWAGMVLVARGEWAEMAHQWWDISTYNHILLVPVILAWLVVLRAPELARLVPQAWLPGFAAVALGLLVWTAGRLSDVNLIAQLGAVMLLQGAAAALLGPRVAAGLLFPVGYMLFLVPFGDEIVPGLQAITARLALGLLHLSGIPARLDGVHIDTPAGLFVVAEACSGVKFLVAMVALASLAAHLGFSGWRRRAAFMVAAIVVPVLANGVRAWGTIFLAQSLGIEAAAGFDHIVYGWIFFALVMAALLAVAWRFFDRSPEDPAIDAAALHSSPILAALARFSVPGAGATVVILLLAFGAAVLVDRMAPLT